MASQHSVFFYGGERLLLVHTELQGLEEECPGIPLPLVHLVGHSKRICVVRVIPNLDAGVARKNWCKPCSVA